MSSYFWRTSTSSVRTMEEVEMDRQMVEVVSRNLKNKVYSVVKIIVALSSFAI